MKGVKVNIGDVFYIKLDEEHYAVGIVMHISRSFKKGVIIGIFDKLVQTISKFEPQEFLSAPFFDSPNYTGIQILKEGDWPIVGNHPELLVEKEIPLLRAGGSVYHKDEVVKVLTNSSELKNYVQLEVQGMFYIENKLCDHFNLN